ncbi:MAG: phosphodiester glycosidase family protein [Ruminococcaceae bacterium]|nr:phosphodiester glycosidase family protein [Oscillospiraceae bacterium]
MSLTIHAKGPERTVDPLRFIESCTVVEDRGRSKTVLITAERAEYVTLTDEKGMTFGEVSNTGEPYDFTAHVFYLPEGFLEGRLTVRFLSRMKKHSDHFTERGQMGVTTLTPDRVTRADRDELARLYDNRITVRKTACKELCDGISYEILDCHSISGAPVKLFALHVSAGAAEFHIGTANNGYAAYGDIQNVKGQAEASIVAGKRVIAATNADFFDMFGNNGPAGLCVKDGRPIANPDSLRSFFGMTRNGKPVIGNFRENPELYGQLLSAVSGREIFLRDGQLSDFSPAEPFAAIPHPRTAVGLDAQGNAVVLVVDGRVPAYSNGASLVDLARIMQRFGMQTAINLDGGGSSTFLVLRDGELTMLNRPADLERPTEPLIRDIYNSLQIVVK